jgi:hypothetical protein
MIIFIDLEETVIQSWFTPFPIYENIHKIKKFAEENNVSKLYIFSLAILNLEDVRKGTLTLAKLELIFGMELIPVTMEHIFSEIKNKHKFVGEINEWSDIFLFNGKEQPFELYINTFAEDEEYVLFDDCVETKTIEYKNKNLKITFKNIGETI